jgi:hypothetical protein
VKTRIISFSIVKDKHCFKASTASLNDYVLDLKLLTSDNPPLSNEQNESIFKHVFEYIKRSERFLVVYVFPHTHNPTHPYQGNNHTHTTPPTPTKETTTHTHNPTHPYQGNNHTHTQPHPPLCLSLISFFILCSSSIYTY